MALKDRLQVLFKTQGLNQKEFASMLEIGQSTLNNYLNGISEPTFKNIMLILFAFPDLNANWLLKGEGSMYKEVFIKNLDSNNGIVQEPSYQYEANKIREVTIYIEKECSATGGACYFDQLKKANERVLELEKLLEHKSK